MKQNKVINNNSWELTLIVKGALSDMEGKTTSTYAKMSAKSKYRMNQADHMSLRQNWDTRMAKRGWGYIMFCIHKIKMKKGKMLKKILLHKYKNKTSYAKAYCATFYI